MYSAANGELMLEAQQDYIFAIYMLSKTEEGKQILKERLGLSDEDLNEPIDGDKLKQILKKYVPHNKHILDEVLALGNEYMLENPFTLSLHDFKVSKIDIELTGDIPTDNAILKDAENKLKDKFPKSDIIISGARAKFGQIRQMTVARGYVSNYWGSIVPYTIKNSYIDGLTQEEFFHSSYGTRKAVLDTAYNVAESGYLTRRLVYSCNAQLDTKLDDCGTPYSMKIENVSEDLAKRLKYRYYYEDEYHTHLKQVTDPKEIIGKTIYLRSPIHCISKHICKKCYGDLYEIHKSRYIGMIAAQTLGERSTQLTLRTFHTGGVAETKSGTKQEDIVSALKLVESIIDKTIPIKSQEDIYNLVFKLYDIFKEYSSMHLVHIETIISEKIYKKHKLWRLTDQLNFDDTKSLSSKILPAYISPILATFFEKTKDNLVKSILYDKENNDSVLVKVMLGLPIK